METLLTKLKNEVGLSDEQALKVMSCITDYMQENGLQPDWEKFLKGKAKNLMDTAKSAFDDFSHKAQDYADKIGDKVEDWADKAQDSVEDLSEEAKQKVNELKKKASDYLSDKD